MVAAGRAGVIARVMILFWSVEHVVDGVCDESEGGSRVWMVDKSGADYLNFIRFPGCFRRFCGSLLFSLLAFVVDIFQLFCKNGGVDKIC